MKTFMTVFFLVVCAGCGAAKKPQTDPLQLELYKCEKQLNLCKLDKRVLEEAKGGCFDDE